MNSILINYDFGISADCDFSTICSTDQRNLWCALVLESIRSRLKLNPLFPLDVNDDNFNSIVCEIHINARPKISNAPKIALYMETPAVDPANNAQNASDYKAVISFDKSLDHLENYIYANLPCWSQTFALYGSGDRVGYVMICGNKRLKAENYLIDLYRERRELIKWFEKKQRKDFHLFGRGWDAPPQLLGFPKIYKFWSRRKLPGKLNSYLGPADKKYDVLSKYKFNFCYENCIYDTYISEKLFDAIIAGCIPIYFSHDFINDLIPNDCFIDASKFDNISSLISYCDGLQESDAEIIIRNGRNFLINKGHNFTHESYANLVIDEISKIVDKY
jgi:hypothetical protein